MTTMTAVRMHEYGDADVLRLDTIPRPATIGPHDLRIDVRAAAINPVDFKIRKGAQRALIRLRLPWTLGMDVSGVVTEIGSKVTHFSVGDEVVSSPSHRRMGCYAEEVILRADECARKPTNLDHVHAAALPLVGLTAHDALVGSAQLKAGEKVLIQAGAGGVGSIAIQLAKQLGAEVYTTCSPRNAALVTELGADHVIDYRAENYEEVARDCDVVLESMGGEHLERAVNTVTRGGRVVSITAGLVDWTRRYGTFLGVVRFGFSFARLAVRARWKKDVRLSFVTRRISGENLAYLGSLVERGAIRPRVDRTYPLAQAAEAHRYLETGHARGKVVLTL
ncbi:MAG: NADP-dependent oxidoreductase [Myxococcota bacterium]